MSSSRQQNPLVTTLLVDKKLWTPVNAAVKKSKKFDDMADDVTKDKFFHQNNMMRCLLELRHSSTKVWEKWTTHGFPWTMILVQIQTKIMSENQYTHIDGIG